MDDSVLNKTDSVPSGFTLSLALVDAIPVILFSISVTVLALRFDSALFVIGALCCTLGGAACVSAWNNRLRIRDNKDNS